MIKIQCSRDAWRIVAMAMALSNSGDVKRAEAEDIMNAWFDRCEQERKRMFPETA